MKSIYQFLTLIFNLFIPSGADIINNPVQSELNSNPIDYIIIVETELLGNKVNILKYHDYYLVTKNLYLINDSTNNLFLLANNNFYSLIQKNDEYIFEFKQKIPIEKMDFYNFITLDKCIDTNSNKICQNFDKEIILYAKSKDGNQIHSYFINGNYIDNVKFDNSDK